MEGEGSDGREWSDGTETELGYSRLWQHPSFQIDQIDQYDEYNFHDFWIPGEGHGKVQTIEQSHGYTYEGRS